MRNAAVIKKEGMDCLIKSLGVLEAEVFISNLLREQYDYTEWQRKYFANQTLDNFLNKAQKYDDENPWEQSLDTARENR